MSLSLSFSAEFYDDGVGVVGDGDDDADGEEGDVDECDADIVDDDSADDVDDEGAVDVDDEYVDAAHAHGEDVDDDDGDVGDDDDDGGDYDGGGGLSLWRSSLQGWSGDCTLSTMHFLQAVP